MKQLLLFLGSLSFGLTTTAQCYQNLQFGGGHTIGESSNGTLWGWGYGGYGELGTTNDTEPLPVQVSTATDWNRFYLGGKTTFAIKDNGTLWGCGSNYKGILGLNTSTQTFSTFQPITAATNWLKISPTQYYTLALKTDGTLWGWGMNNYYQLGFAPAIEQQMTPVQIGTDTDWVDLSSGTSGTNFAIKADGTIWGWGSNLHNLLHFGSDVTYYTTPTLVNSQTDWVKISSGGTQILAQKSDGTLWSWGAGPAMGIGTSIPTTTTAQQISTDTWKYFTTGVNTSFGIKSDGTLWGWGRNYNGQVGDGTTIDRYYPVQLGSATNWDTVQARDFQTFMATKTDGTVWYWGINYYGEFGNGMDYDATYYLTPQLTPGVCAVPLTTQGFNKITALDLYPNPAKQTVTIAYDLNEQPTDLIVYDLFGRTVYQRNVHGLTGNREIPLEQLQEGIYLVTIQNKSKIIIQEKLIKQ
ncbi:RCC1 (Regulator of Chromosome Condensation) repeat domain protein precursor [Flavobacterium indicum GPTSA100-9 = DSM 17447]|uniref:RCC1 (Regulator of Chromosome Condensation) repeat domain protein n=1 Tax=Flavobacterium indicum (strain DSM 17447 / CIP 109464 / GPTSA100-9) TaxID=1094466 RepID=H8XT17_FLAIG|nr:T9SS type A sorting domain-containing protein [Flavobacterium indicum]CCG53559.1 RCC1 (Regulator of Chromosome Condensation) repeat domain protein precursor [Flavobacterium indicum GPTSA100-9 = DSM 17447]